MELILSYGIGQLHRAIGFQNKRRTALRFRYIMVVVTSFVAGNTVIIYWFLFVGEYWERDRSTTEG
jgi:hypothetical protein